MPVAGQKVWDDESNVHGLRPAAITVQLYANGVLVNATPTWTSTTGDTWSYTFGNRPLLDENGDAITYTVRELPVEGYTTAISGTTITNTLIPRTPREYTDFNGVKTWIDSNNASGMRPNYITIQMLRDGEVVEERTVTAANNWAYSFTNVPLDDGYGYTYTYTFREVAVPGYYTLQEDELNFTNGRIPETPLGATPRNLLTDEELEDLVDLLDYDTPLVGIQQTGDDIPLYPFIFGGLGIAAIAAFLVLGKKNRKGEAA